MNDVPLSNAETVLVIARARRCGHDWASVFRAFEVSV
jgi:hypothetical protein